MMKISVGSRRQLALLAILAGVLIMALVRSGRNEASRSTRASLPLAQPATDSEDGSASRGRGRGEAKKMSADDVPVITRHDLDPIGSAPGAGSRNIFDFRPPTPLPLPTATPAPPPAPVCGDPRFLGPCPPPPPTPTPMPPEISFKFIGSFGPKDQPIAVLVAGDKVVNAKAGDVVFDRFILKKVGYESIDVGFIGPWSEVRRLAISQ
jgi:hypothetical protein